MQYLINNFGDFSLSNEFIKINELDIYQIIKILGMKFNPIEHRSKILNFNKVFPKLILKLKYKVSEVFYKMIYIAKRYILLKFNKDWSKRELRNWLKANLVTFKIWKNANLNDSILIANITRSDFSRVTKLFKNIIYQNFKQVKDGIKFGNLNKNSIKIESIFNKDSLDINKNIHENKSKNYISKNNFINKNFNFYKNNVKNILKIKKIHEKIICAKFSVVSEYILIIFIG